MDSYRPGCLERTASLGIRGSLRVALILIALAAILPGPGLADEVSDFLERAGSVSDEAEAVAVVNSGTQLAMKLGNLKRNDEARAVYEASYEVATTIPEVWHQALLVLNMVAVLRAAGAEALLDAHLKETRSRLPEKHAFVPYVDSQRAQSKLLKQDFGGALRLLENLEQGLGKDPGSRSCCEYIHRLRGEAYLNQGQLEKASREFRASRGIVEALLELDDRMIDRPALEYSLYYNQTMLAQAQGHFARVAHWAREGLARSTLIARYPHLRPTLNLQLGIARLMDQVERGELDLEPITYFDAVLDDEAAFLTLKQDAESRKACALLLAGEHERAAESLRSYRARQRGPGGASASGLDDEAFVVALETRLSDERGEDLSQALPRLESAILSLREQWRSGTGFLHYARPRFAIGTWIELVIRERPEGEGVEDAFQMLLEIEQSGTLARELGVQTTLAELSALLPPGGGYLLYFRAMDRSHTFLLDGEGLLHEPLRGRDAIEDLRHKFYQGLLSKGRADAAGSRLAELLLPPSLRERLVSLDSITVAGLDRLGYVPFECLPFGDDSYLGLELAVAYLPALSLVSKLSERIPVADGARATIVVAGGATRGEQARQRYSKLPAIPFREPQLKGLTGGYPDGSVSGLTGASVTYAAVRGALDSRVRVLHLIAHGIRDEELHVPAGLLLAPGDEDPGLVWSDRLRALPAPALVLLSTCGSGRGPQRVGDPASTTLEGLFLSSGAGAVVWSRADLLYEPNLELMSEFHRHLAEGATTAEALRLARVALASADPAHLPGTWGLVHASGAAHLPIFP